MGYTLQPKNKKIEELNIGAFSWPIFLQETGMGYILGYGSGRAPAQYVYNSGNHGSPASNDGYIVTSFEAKAMAKCAKGFVSVQRFVNKDWEDNFTVEQYDELIKRHYNGNKTYRSKWHEDRLKDLERIAEFMEQSRGFRIK